ncbi:MAG: winged helix-turn-helix transcriptional regulator [Planctomycetales bacterium]|nr:winged helix-turn-helix transcriptional regulator [Planctomycetales bacterium]
MITQPAVIIFMSENPEGRDVSVRVANSDTEVEALLGDKAGMAPAFSLTPEMLSESSPSTTTLTPSMLENRLPVFLVRSDGHETKVTGPVSGEASASVVSDSEIVRIECDGFRIDRASHRVILDGRNVSLTATEFRLVWTLAANPDLAFTREDLVKRCCRPGSLQQLRTVDVHIRGIRRKFREQRDLIETVRGIGYRFGREPQIVRAI